MASATVVLPGVLQPVVSGERRVSVVGDTVADALEDLCRQHPALRPRLFEDDGRWRRHVLCVLRSEPVDPAAGIQLGEGDELIVMPAVSGG